MLHKAAYKYTELSKNKKVYYQAFVIGKVFACFLILLLLLSYSLSTAVVLYQKHFE